MPGLASFGKTLVVVGAAVAALGLVLWLGGRIGFGRVPGGGSRRRGNFAFYFPVVTSLLLSLLLTIALNLLFRRRW